MIFWEWVDNYTHRAAVFGGWLIKITEDVHEKVYDHTLTRGHNFRIAATFVPDPDHEWDLSKDYSINTEMRTSWGEF